MTYKSAKTLLAAALAALSAATVQAAPQAAPQRDSVSIAPPDVTPGNFGGGGGVGGIIAGPDAWKMFAGHGGGDVWFDQNGLAYCNRARTKPRAYLFAPGYGTPDTRYMYASVNGVCLSPGSVVPKMAPNFLRNTYPTWQWYQIHAQYYINYPANHVKRSYSGGDGGITTCVTSFHLESAGYVLERKDPSNNTSGCGAPLPGLVGWSE